MHHAPSIPHQAPILLFLLQLLTPTLYAAVPMHWTVDVSRVKPEVRDVVRGETIDMEATLKKDGKPFEMGSEPVCIFWQTNGMGRLWWSAPAQVLQSPTPTPNSNSTSNLLAATFTPAMDPGAATVNGFIGSTGDIYRAAFQLRFRHGPGAVPNALPLPVQSIDFARVTVINPPWATPEDMPDGSARPLPKYLHALDFDYGHPEDAKKYYRIRGAEESEGGCSAVRSGNFLCRNFDFPFDGRAEFVVRMSAGPNRFASVGVAQVGTNLTEEIVTSGKPSRCYKWLPGATVDGINENGVVAEINVVDGDPQTSDWHNTGDLHPLAAVRWALDHATNAQHGAEYIAANIKFPQGWTQDFHYMIADERETYIVENGAASNVTAVAEKRVMTNFPILPDDYEGMGAERYVLLLGGASITNAWYTNSYRRETNPPWVSDLAEVIAYTNEIFTAWATHPKEHFRGKTNNGIPWWQTVHTSIYDITNRVLRVAVQETDDWYVFQVPSSCGGSPIDTNAVIDIATSVVAPAVNAAVRTASALAGGAATSSTNYTDTVAASKADADDLDNYLHLGGGTMRGDINMDYYDIIDVSNLSAYGLTVYESAAFEADASVSGDLSVGNILSVDNTIDLNGTGDIINANSVTANNVAADDVIYYGNRSLMSLDAQVAGKINRVLDATTGNLAVFSSSGNLSDSRISSSVITNHSAQLSSLSTQVSSLSSSKANLTGGNIFYGDQWVANGDLNLAGAGLYMDRSGTGQEYIYGKWTGDMFAFEGTSPLLFLNEVYFSTAYGNRPKIDDSPIATEDDVEPIRTAANDALSYGRGIFMYMNGTTNCYFSGTNYVIGAESTNRTAFALEDGMDLATVPCSMALWEIRDGTRQCVWDQRDWTVWYWNFKLAQYRDEHDGRDAALRELIAGRCPLNWASYTACGLTNAAGDTTWIDTPKVVLSAGFAWQHQLTAEGVGYWGIQGNGYEVGGSGTNSTLRITDWEGNEVLKITKGSARLAYLTGGSGAASGWDGGWMWYDMQCDAQPTGEFTVDLLDTFVEEGDGCPAEVREYVDRGNGVWRCYFRARPGINATACFARFKVQVGTETTVEYGTAPTVPGLIVNGRKIAPVIPSNAHVGDTITWKVVQ